MQFPVLHLQTIFRILDFILPWLKQSVLFGPKWIENANNNIERLKMLSWQVVMVSYFTDQDGSEHVPEETPNGSSENGEISNGDCEEEKASHDEPCGISEEHAKTTEGNGLAQLKPPRVLEALSASVLRALRYAREVEGIGQVVALDNDKVSVEACRRNIKFIGSVACSKVESHLADAHVNLDPYGSPSVFLDSAVQSVVDGGMLMCTATDMAVLCGEMGRYGSHPLRGKYCHGVALRILLACIESHANRYKRYIVPMLSVQIDFYVRVFVRIYLSASAMKSTPLKLSYVYQCTGCDSFLLQPIGRTIAKNNSVRHLPGFGPVVPQECTDCGKKLNMGAYLELPDDPLFLSLHSLCATLKCTSLSPVIFRSALINAGYCISGTHVNPLGLKSDAPMDVIWDIMRCWVKNHPVKAQPLDQPGSVILAKEAANLARAVASLSKAQAKKVARFLPNPERHWGPKLRAGHQITTKHISLLGEEVVNGIQNQEDGEEPEAKHQRTEEPDSAS
ncbi:hypothetical protein TIFTF001_013710 [Ficus carica]|uniref:tRNA (guanine(26)-N(2))-dimethyltransferase n=1 Tax=Ficus carica TaxID=3494 RepID=A0AA88D7I1_FICCA|nr:hypothetical protein TIFTF001_013710 [Ficus carica]